MEEAPQWRAAQFRGQSTGQLSTCRLRELARLSTVVHDSSGRNSNLHDVLQKRRNSCRCNNS